MDTTYQPHKFDQKNILFVFALEVEAGQEFDDCTTLFTGVGKLNAAYQLSNYLKGNQPELIVNLGTAGSAIFERGTLVCCDRFIQRDMDASELGFSKFKTPFATDEVILDYGLKMNELPISICGSGDHFETAHSDELYQVVDMEAYALAWVAKQENIPFLCIKYISDGANDDAAADWNQQVKFASKKLRALF